MHVGYSYNRYKERTDPRIERKQNMAHDWLEYIGWCRELKYDLDNKFIYMPKMTDEQLVHYVEDRVEKARSEGFNCGKTQAPKHKTVDITGIIEEISSVKGIGATKLADIKAILEKHLEVRTDA